jgi:hypothetical protein
MMGGMQPASQPLPFYLSLYIHIVNSNSVLQRLHWHGQIPGVGLPFPAVGGVTFSLRVGHKNVRTQLSTFLLKFFFFLFFHISGF